MKKIILLAILIAALSSCFSDNFVDGMSDGIAESLQMVNDQEFQKALSHIEMHKLRNGTYPDELADLEYLNPMDSRFLNRVEYFKLDSVYELNLKSLAPIKGSNNGKKKKKKMIAQKYPAEFWEGLGCVKSNLK